MTELLKYDAMCHAIAEAHSVDEVKAIRDKAIMLETYARIFCDIDNERKAYEIRVRAEQRYGEMRKENPLPAGRPKNNVAPVGGDYPSIAPKEMRVDRLAVTTPNWLPAILLKRVNA